MSELLESWEKERTKQQLIRSDLRRSWSKKSKLIESGFNESRRRSRRSLPKRGKKEPMPRESWRSMSSWIDWMAVCRICSALCKWMRLLLNIHSVGWSWDRQGVECWRKILRITRVLRLFIWLKRAYLIMMEFAWLICLELTNVWENLSSKEITWAHSVPSLLEECSKRIPLCNSLI